MVTRSKSETDGRLVLVSLTDKGRKMMDILFPEFNANEKEVAGVVSEARQKDLADLLRLITVGVEKKN